MSPLSSASRREFLKAASVTSAVFGAPAAQLLAGDTRQASDNAGRARNIIFMVSDGMNHGALSLAQHFSHAFRNRQTHWTRLYRERPVVRSLVETFSANSPVTDSAAAASAWGGGHRVDNGALNVTADKRPWAPLHTKLKQARILTGLVSTATITHATPAGFAVNIDSRGEEAKIAEQYWQREVPVLLGGGQPFFSDRLREKFRAKGYDVLNSRAELKSATGSINKPVLGVFSRSHLPYAIDCQADEALRARIPTLAEMARFAVQRLEAMPNHGWFLMVEGARIDHCGHANDAAGSIHEQLAFDEAVGAMVELVSTRSDTLLIITTDHGCGGIQLNGVNASKEQKMAPGIYNGTTAAFRQVAGFQHSFEWLQDKGAGLSGPPLRAFLKQHTGLELSDEELKKAQGLKALTLAPVFAPRHGIAWTSGNHTGELIEFCATGPGSHHFPAFLKNYEVHDLLLKAYGMG